jgi:LysR family transcriptional regulator, regulator for metE and metH
MVACGRGVAALPAWLVAEYEPELGVVPVRLGRHGIAKQIFLGVRSAETDVDYIADFVRLAKAEKIRPPTAKRKRARRKGSKR